MIKLGHCVNDAYEKYLNGSFMWTAYNEIVPRWDYIKSWDNGWINKTAVANKTQQELGVKPSEGRPGALDIQNIEII